jgi:hypothetical protein
MAALPKNEMEMCRQPGRVPNMMKKISGRDR